MSAYAVVRRRFLTCCLLVVGDEERRGWEFDGVKKHDIESACGWYLGRDKSRKGNVTGK